MLDQEHVTCNEPGKKRATLACVRISVLLFEFVRAQRDRFWELAPLRLPKGLTGGMSNVMPERGPNTPENGLYSCFQKGENATAGQNA